MNPAVAVPCPARTESTASGAAAAVVRGSPSARLLEFVDAAEFPCVGSKAALARGAIRTHECGRLGARTNDTALLGQLQAFAKMVDSLDADDPTVHSFVAIFDGPHDTGEQRFEALLWSQLQRLHDLDAGRRRRPGRRAHESACKQLLNR